MVESMYTLSLNKIHRLAACRKKICQSAIDIIAMSGLTIMDALSNEFRARPTHHYRNAHLAFLPIIFKDFDGHATRCPVNNLELLNYLKFV